MQRLDIQGRTINGVRRVLYVLPDNGVAADGGGPVEFRLDDGRVFWLDAGPDGESLKVTWEAWSDHFAAPLSDENKRFVAHAGKWTAFDVAERSPYSKLVGATVRDVAFRTTPEGKVMGLRISTDVVVLECVVEADELYVDVA